MSGSIEDLSVRLGRRSATRLAWAATVTAIVWSIAANFLQAGLEQLPACADFGCTEPQLKGIGARIGGGLALALVGLYVALKWGIPAARGAFLRSVAVVRRNGQARAARALVLTLSDLRQPSEIALADDALAHANTAADDASRNRVLSALCDPSGAWKGWRWQQPLRLLRHNMGRLEVMVFVLTPEAAPQFATHFRPLLSLLKPTLSINPGGETAVEVVDLSDYNEVTHAIERACAAALAGSRRRARDLCIDITSGTKAWSAAATVKTLNSAAVFSYVETDAPYDVVTYDASLTA